MTNDQTGGGRIILPLDGMDQMSAIELARKVLGHPALWGVKLNDLLDQAGIEILLRLKYMGIKVFAGPKLKDIKETNKNRIARYKMVLADFVTVHASYPKELAAAVKEYEGSSTKVLAITIPTDMGSDEVKAVYGTMDVLSVVKRLASLAKSKGAHGIVCSPKEVGELKTLELIKVTPGIRPAWYQDMQDDQSASRRATPADAIKAGADLIVCGRPIIKAKDPIEALDKIGVEVRNALESPDCGIRRE